MAVTNSHSLTRHWVLRSSLLKNFGYEARIFFIKHGDVAVADKGYAFRDSLRGAAVRAAQKCVSRAKRSVRRPYSKDATFLVKFH